jgi:hypothetical protein
MTAIHNKYLKFIITCIYLYILYFLRKSTYKYISVYTYLIKGRMLYFTLGKYLLYEEKVKTENDYKKFYIKMI